LPSFRQAKDLGGNEFCLLFVAIAGHGRPDSSVLDPSQKPEHSLIANRGD
jgi:hypothetical protein